MVIYRPHRGSLNASIKECVEFKSEEEMKKYIVKQWNSYFSEDDIVIGKQCFNDERIGWTKSRYVCTKRFGNQEYRTPQCIGTCFITK